MCGPVGERRSAMDINGTPGPDPLQGTDTGDVIHGLAGDDTIVGGGGNDRIFGDEGDDKIDIGGTGSIQGIDMDVATGGPGRDEFIVTNPGSGVDTITDFNYQEDHILLAGGAVQWNFDGQDTTLYHPTGMLILDNFDFTPYAGAYDWLTHI